ncbi:MAG TPA: anion permease, partial [Saprospiraceae bacterium]|nr:anion permease [Saprospiraceae bacterium]
GYEPYSSSLPVTANILLPVLASMAVAAAINPLLLMIPAAVASSLGFMMPAGTGPNTVIFGSERVTVADMVKCGFWLDLISLLIVVVMMYFIIMPWLGFDSALPQWAI